ncbi:hypothetical protein D3C77_809560 [compost metagenome]
MLAMDALNLQTVKETLSTGIVVAVALGAHAAMQMVHADQHPVSRRAVPVVPASLLYVECQCGPD